MEINDRMAGAVPLLFCAFSTPTSTCKLNEIIRRFAFVSSEARLLLFSRFRVFKFVCLLRRRMKLEGKQEVKWKQLQ